MLRPRQSPPSSPAPPPPTPNPIGALGRQISSFDQTRQLPISRKRSLCGAFSLFPWFSRNTGHGTRNTPAPHPKLDTNSTQTRHTRHTRVNLTPIPSTTCALSQNQDLPQTLSNLCLAHTIDHTRGVEGLSAPSPSSSFTLTMRSPRALQNPASPSLLLAALTDGPQLIQNTTTSSPAFATLTILVNAKSFACHSSKKLPGWATAPLPSSSASATPHQRVRRFRRVLHGTRATEHGSRNTNHESRITKPGTPVTDHSHITPQAHVPTPYGSSFQFLRSRTILP